MDVKPANICFTAELRHPKLVDFDAAMKLEHPGEVTTRFAGNLSAISPEREEKQLCSRLAEDAFMTGCTFTRLVEETQGEPDQVLLARLRPLLGRA